jgi:CxxC-x17-CxxC domain-containing protein
VINNELYLFKKRTPLVLIMAKLRGIMSEDRKMYPIKCSDCGTDSEVPFEPKPDRPVYCKECLPKHRSGGKSF